MLQLLMREAVLMDAAMCNICEDDDDWKDEVVVRVSLQYSLVIDSRWVIVDKKVIASL